MVSRQIVPTNPMTFGESKQWQVSNGNDGVSSEVSEVSSSRKMSSLETLLFVC